MLGRVKLVLHLVRLLLSRSEDLAQSRAEVLLSAFDAWETRNCGLNIIEYDRNIYSQFAENWANRPLGLLKHCSEQMFGFNLLILISLCKLDGRLDGFLSSKRKLV